MTEARLLAAASDTANWMTHGRTWDEQRFVPLDGINSGNVSNLGLAWYFDIPTNRGIEATPLVIDGVMYVVTRNKLIALEEGIAPKAPAKTGG